MLDYMRIMINARLAKMDERGASAVEYGLLVAGIAAVIVGIVFVLGKQLSTAFDTTSNSISTGNWLPPLPGTAPPPEVGRFARVRRPRPSPARWTTLRPRDREACQGTGRRVCRTRTLFATELRT